ncbi:hypothetical protein VTN96DRAFT_9718 [Rasamsonia emersonii]
MERPPIPRAIPRVQILPEDGISRDGAERHARIPGLVAIDETTPSVVATIIISSSGRRIQQREIGPSTRSVLRRGDIDKERGEPVPAQVDGRLRGGLEPVRMGLILFSELVAHELERLEMRARDVQALEGEGAVLDAADDVVARGTGRARCPRGGVGQSRAGFVDDFRVCELLVAVG